MRRRKADIDAFRAAMTELRAAAGLTQTDLAERCGWRQARISELENGIGAGIAVQHLARWAHGLDCAAGLWIFTDNHYIAFNLTRDETPLPPLATAVRLILTEDETPPPGSASDADRRL